jgi:tellurium resistance protein TerZ
LKEVVFGLSWDQARPDTAGVAEPVDLDASCILLDEQLNVIEIVHPGRMRNANGSVVHTDDPKSGGGG